MRRILILALAGTFAVLTMGADSCSTDTKDTADNSSTSSSSSGGGKSKPKAPKAHIGDFITLRGGEKGEKIKVKVNRVIDPLAGGEFDQPSAGKRYVGVEITLKNVGTTTYSDSPSNGAQLIGTNDRQFDSTLLSGGPCGDEFSASAKIAPGDRRVGCIPFEVGKHAKLKKFQFTLSSGFGPDNGEWLLR
jgi:hypothetical protein